MPSNWQISTAKTYCWTFFLIARAVYNAQVDRQLHIKEEEEPVLQKNKNKGK